MCKREKTIGNEPLKNKIRLSMVITKPKFKNVKYKSQYIVFRAEDVKSAVAGMLEEFKLKCYPYDFLTVGKRKLSYEEIANIVKKWMEDAMENE